MTLDLKLDLPENVFKEAKEAGLLQPAEIERLLREELRRRRVDDLFVTTDKLDALDIPPLTEEELEAEIAAAREARAR